MPIYLDDEATPLTTGTLDEALDAARDRLADAGRIVVEVELDGQLLSAEDIDSQADVAMGDHELRLTSADPRELATATLLQIQAGLESSIEIQQKAAELLQQDNLQDALQEIGLVVEIWQQAGQAVLHSAMLTGVQLDTHEFEGMPVQDATAELLQQVSEFKELIEVNDTVAMADVLAYEWPALSKKWVRLVQALVGWIAA